MKVKKIRIKIMEMNEWFDHVEVTLRNLGKEKSKVYPTTVSFTNIELARKVLSPRRMQLMAVIKHKKPASIYELAKIVRRDRRAVVTDINILQELGFVILKKHLKERTVVTPQVPFEEIDIRLKV